MIYSIRKKKNDLYRQNGMKYYITQQLMLFCSFPNISFNQTDSNKTRQRKRRRLAEVKKKLKDTIMHYNAEPALEPKIDIEAVCSLSDNVILPWDAQGDGKQVFFVILKFIELK